jgi:uncharacterized surface protein with fasciclin (FAS1) repeats
MSLDANIVDTLAQLEGPGQVWGAEGIAVGKEENDLKGYDGFGLFSARLASTGVAAELKGAGPFTLFAPVDSAVETYEEKYGPVTAEACKYSIVTGTVAASAASSAALVTSQGESLKYSRKFRKDFINDSILGGKTFGPYSDFPTDVACDNGVIHAVGEMLAPGYAAVGGGVGATNLV